MKKMMMKMLGRGNSSSLTAGAVVVSAPDGATCPPEQTERGIAWFAARGCRVKLADHYYGKAGFLAAKPEEVVADLHAMAADDDVDLILCAGGGANANALLPHLDYAALARAGKPIVGLSNPTVILNAITAKTGLVTYHGPALIHNFGSEEGVDAFTENHFIEMLGAKGPVTIEAEPQWRWLREGRAQGRLYGGNLWSLEHLLGTKYAPDWSGAILFIEDCFCELHQVYASLEHFKDAGVFDQIAGLVVGIPLEVAESECPYTGTFNDVVAEVVKDYDFPVLTNVHLGHTDRKLTLPIGALCMLDSARSTMVCDPNS